MITLEAVEALIRAHGLALMFPLAIVEGPIVTIIAGALAGAGLLSLAGVYGMAVLADLVGDVLVYGIGRMAHRLPTGFASRIGLGAGRLDRLALHFRDHGTATLVVAKLTHAAGFAALAAAGAARMPFGLFVAANLIATLPKAAVLVAVGLGIGAAYDTADRAIFVGSLVMLGLLVLAFIGWRIRRRRALP